VILKGLVVKTNWLAVNRHSWSNSDSEEEAVGREPRLREDLSAEVEELPLLEAVTRRGLVKTLHAGEDLACAVWFVKCVNQR
jgi:hypothetical protein